MKPKYLLDECACNSKTFGGTDFVRSVDLVGMGATDDQIFELAKKMKITIVTKDKGFALKILSEKYPVIYSCGETMAFVIPKKVELNRKYSDPVTFYLLNSQSVVRD